MVEGWNLEVLEDALWIGQRIECQLMKLFWNKEMFLESR
jgi:hypothetical protein